MIAEYLRKSRAEELTDSTEEVLEKHRTYLAEYASSHGIIISDVYEEVLSGESIAARPEMKKLLAAVRAGKYDAVLCMDIDRLGRGGMQDQGVILDAFRETGTLIITPDKTYDLSNEQDEMLTEFKSFMSRQEYKIIRKRMLRGKIQSVEAGGHVGPAPYGYKKCRVGKTPSLEIIPEEAEIVRYMYKRYIEGAGAIVIADELNRMGSHPKNYHEWTRPTIGRILQNPIYSGKTVWNRVKTNKKGTASYETAHTYKADRSEWIITDGLHEAIIPPEEWETAQRVRAEKRIVPKSKQLVNAFAGLLVCAKCGRKMQRRSRTFGKDYIYYVCDRRGCNPGVKAEHLESAIRFGLYGKLDELKAKITSNPDPDTSMQEAALQSVEAELTKIEARLSRLFDFLEDGTYDKATFQARRTTLEGKKEVLLQTQNRLRSEITEKRSIDLPATAQKLESLLDSYDILGVEEKNALMKELIEKIAYQRNQGTAETEFSLVIYGKNYIF